MKYRLLTILLFTAKLMQGQQFFMSTFLGGASYQGDLQPAPLSLQQIKPAFAGGFDIGIIPHLDAKLEYSIARITASDFYNKANKARNLSFSSDIYELSLAAEYYVLDLDKFRLTPYLYGGMAYFKFTPFVDLTDGNRIFLPDIDTEGQTFYQDRQKYKLTLLTGFFGGGIMWALSPRFRIGYTIGIRKTPTDYLDDVSTTYVDETQLRQKHGNVAVSLAYRGDQLPNGSPYPAAGTPRGNPSNNDSYCFTGLSMRFALNPKGRNPSSAPPKVPKSRVTCPKVF